MAAFSIQASLASIFQRLGILEENQSRSNAAIAKMRAEMENTSSSIQELEFSHESALREINSLLRRFGEQMTTARRKEQEKLRSAFLCLREEIEEVRNTCRLLKLENKKLLKELEEANNAAADTGEELDRERRARELMEEVCNELAREIGEDKAEVEQLKQEQAKSREMVEEELKMMRMASLWQDERVRAKVSEAQIELDGEHEGAIALEEIKRKIEEFVSTVSEVGLELLTDPAHAEFLEEKQKEIIEQAKMVRQALELGMKQQIANEGDAGVQADFVLKEEKILTPVIPNQHSSHIAANATEAHGYGEQRMSPIDCVDRHIKPSCAHMLRYSKKPCKETRRPRLTSGDDRDYHPHPLHLLSHDGHLEARPEFVSGRMIIENDRIQALRQSPSPEQLMYESSKLWLASEKHRKKQGLHSLSFTDRNEPRMDDSRLLQRSFSSARMAPKELHRKQLSLHFGDTREDNADVWQHHATLNGQEQSYSEGDTNHVVCPDGDGRETKQTMDRRRPTCICTVEKAVCMHPWKSPGLTEMMDHDDLGHHAECPKQREYKDAKSLGVGEAEGEEHGDFHGFYFEPVLDASALSVCDVQEDGDKMADDDARSVSSVYKPAQQSKSPKEIIKSSGHGSDGHGHSSSRYGGTLAKEGSHREEGPQKLPANLVPLVKSQFSSPKCARSVSPSKPHVLQCFRPPPTSPEHSLTSPLFKKSYGKASNEASQLVVEAQSKASPPTSHDTMIAQAEAHLRDGKAGDGADASTSSKSPEEKKGNSLLSELLKARDMDLQQYVNRVHYNMQKQAAVAASSPPAIEISTASSLFRFSPLRKSLTSNFHGSH